MRDAPDHNASVRPVGRGPRETAARWRLVEEHSLGTDLDEGTPAISLPTRRANDLFLAVYEKVVLSCGLTSDWPFGDADFWPKALGIEDDALLAVWDYDYYVIIVATRPQPDRTAFVELRFSTHEQVSSGRLTP